MSLTFERKLPIILFFVFLMLTTVGVVFYQTTVAYRKTLEWQIHTREVVSTVDDTIALALQSYMAVDNFVEVSNNTYLDPFERAKPKIRQNIDQLRALSRDHPEQSDEINRLDQSLKQFVAAVTARIDLRKTAGNDFPVDQQTWREGQLMLDRIQASGDVLKKREINEQQVRDRSTENALTATVWILIVSSLAGIISLGVANLTVISEIKKRRAAQTELMELNEGLERNVEDRTAELKRANEMLLAAGLERESILQSEKEARREAEIANRLRDEFMASVSHELRTPLNSILGWARLMKGGTLDRSQSEKALSTIIKNSETQNRLIEDLLDVARVISGKLQLEIVELDPTELVSEAIETVRPAANARNIRIEFEPRADSELFLEGDHNRLVQVFTNLLGNALKFSPEGTIVHVSLSDEDGNFVFQVMDEGRGISPAFLPLVFERFRQDVRSKTNNGGLGLGLAIVRNLVEMHGGVVKAESEGENRGSTFTVLLPARSRRDAGNAVLEL